MRAKPPCRERRRSRNSSSLDGLSVTYFVGRRHGIPKPSGVSGGDGPCLVRSVQVHHRGLCELQVLILFAAQRILNRRTVRRCLLLRPCGSAATLLSEIPESTPALFMSILVAGVHLAGQHTSLVSAVFNSDSNR